MLCILQGSLVAALAASSFSLSWTHSVEKTTWSETWRVSGGRLTAVEAMVEGSGAGIDVPDDAVMTSEGWRYRPTLPPLKELVLGASGATGDGWRLCTDARCLTLAETAGPPILIFAESPSRPCEGRPAD